jgi:hypothetical protein
MNEWLTTLTKVLPVPLGVHAPRAAMTYHLSFKTSLFCASLSGFAF